MHGYHGCSDIVDRTGSTVRTASVSEPDPVRTTTQGSGSLTLAVRMAAS
jgi:hypothetical protein